MRQMQRRAQAAQRDAQLMHTFQIAAVFRSGHGLQQVLETAAQNDREGLVEGNRGVEVELARFFHRRRAAGRQLEAARRFAAHRRTQPAVLGEPLRQLIDRRRAAALEFELDLADRQRALARA